MKHLFHLVFEPGFFGNKPVHTALIVSAVVGFVSGVVGVFTVLRGQSFAGHALTDVSTTGGSAAILSGAAPATGFVGAGVIGALVMDVIGVSRVRRRDLATGVVLSAAIGLAALLLYFSTTSSANTGATQRILFGSIFTIAADSIPVIAVFSVASLGIVAVAARPLLLSSISEDIAAARGVRIRLVGSIFMIAMAAAVGLSSLAIGSILSTAMLVGPAAAAIRLTNSIVRTLEVACLIAIGGAWLGILLAYDSASWGSSHKGLPVSFFIVAVYFVIYLASGIRGARRT